MLIRWGWSRHAGGWVQQMPPISPFFPFLMCLGGGKRRLEGVLPYAKPLQHLGMGDSPLMIPCRPWYGEECSEGITWVVLVPMRCCWPCCSNIEETPQRSTPVCPLYQTFVAKAWPGQLSNMLCFPSSNMALDIPWRPKCPPYAFRYAIDHRHEQLRRPSSDNVPWGQTTNQ